MSFPPGADSASRAVLHDNNGEYREAVEHYTTAADVLERTLNSGHPLPAGPNYHAFVSQYRERAAELTRELQRENGAGAQSGHNSAMASASTSASAMLQKFKYSASKAASKTKDAAISVGAKAKTAASSAYATTTTAVNKQGSLANQFASAAARSAGYGFGGNIGWNAGQTVSNAVFPSVPRRR